ncbi:hypothetical protein BTH42_22475 [Burkholderia sp. SRS-W-2-2016]|uniref:hypothetical protein n=1 Tax=Burkholderia sp. SRS-W-2-2016 TaxID=1926878 RepID=UPI00094B48C1|nr:hypothetical protein [Burkholderia sp. SRS-W-2-2016]OLL29499.1 hypothetical protein BTH42_22475 [Burkholderia sp. SRS-W-2-2016]
MSFAALKWVLKPEGTHAHQPPMSTEKKWFLAHLAWEAGRNDNMIRKDIATLAAEAGITARMARRYVRELMAEGPLRFTGERTGYHNRVAVYEFVCAWIQGATAVAASHTPKKERAHRRLNGAANDTIQDLANGAGNDTIQDDGMMLQDAPFNDTKQHHSTTRNSTIQTPLYIRGLQRKTKGTNKHKQKPSVDDVCGPPAPEKSDVQEQADSRSNVAVQTTAVDRMRLNTTTYARARRKDRRDGR